MFQIIIFLIFFIVITYISGSILRSILFKNEGDNISLGEIGFLGFSLLIFISFLTHFFFPLSKLTNFIIFAFLILIFLITNKKNLFSKKYDLRVLFIFYFLTFLLTIYQKPHEDFGYYHLPYIINIISEKIIFGLSNLQSQYAWNSSWLNTSSLFNFYFIDFKGTILLNSVLYFYSLIFFYEKIISKDYKKNLSILFCIFFAYYFLIKFTRLTEYGFDMAANMMIFLSIFYLLEFFEKKENSKIAFKFLILFCAVSITVKLSAFITFFILLIAMIIFIKNNKSFDFILPTIIFCCFLILFWVLQQIIYSGCAIPFFDFTCLSSLEWYSDDISYSINQATGAFNKSFSSYGGILNKQDYIKNFNWISTWYSRNHIEIFEHLLAISFPMILVILMNIKKNTFDLKAQTKAHYVGLKSLVILFFVGFLIWFLKSPVIRFGIIYIYIFCFLIFYFSFLKKNYSNIDHRWIKTIFIISIFFTGFKNIDRIYKKFDPNNVWPNTLKVEYSSSNINNFVINYPSSKKKFHQFNYCWSIPYICHMSAGKKLDIFEKYSYTFILKIRVSKSNE